MFNNSNVADYYASKINDLRKNILKGNLPQKEKYQFLAYLNKAIKMINSNWTTKQVNEFLRQIEEVYRKTQVKYIDKLNALYLYFKNNGYFPSVSDKKTTFEDGTIMSDFILDNMDYLQKMYAKNKPIQFALRKYEAFSQLNLDDNKEISIFRVKLLLVFKYLFEHKRLPLDDKVKFPDGESYLKWVNQNEQMLRHSMDYRAKAIISDYNRMKVNDDFMVAFEKLKKKDAFESRLHKK